MLHSSSGAAFREELAYLPDLFPFLVSVVGLKVPSLVSLGALEAPNCLLHREPVSAQRGQDARLRSEPQPGTEPQQQGKREAGRRQDHTVGWSGEEAEPCIWELISLAAQSYAKTISQPSLHLQTFLSPKEMGGG